LNDVGISFEEGQYPIAGIYLHIVGIVEHCVGSTALGPVGAINETERAVVAGVRLVLSAKVFLNTSCMGAIRT